MPENMVPSQAFDIVDNPLRGENAMQSLSGTSFAKHHTADTTNFTLTWVADRDAVDDDILCAWLKTVFTSHNGCPSDCAKVLIQAFYNTLMPLHCTLQWQYTLPSGAVRKLHILRHQPLYKLPEGL